MSTVDENYRVVVHMLPNGQPFSVYLISEDDFDLSKFKQAEEFTKNNYDQRIEIVDAEVVPMNDLIQIIKEAYEE